MKHLQINISKHDYEEIMKHKNELKERFKKAGISRKVSGNAIFKFMLLGQIHHLGRIKPKRMKKSLGEEFEEAFKKTF